MGYRAEVQKEVAKKEEKATHHHEPHRECQAEVAADQADAKRTIGRIQGKNLKW